MLLRDRYSEDAVMQYFPNFSILSYVNHLTAVKPHYRYIMTKQEQKNWNSKLTSALPASMFFLALLPIFFHKRIPKLRNFTSIKARVLLGCIYMMLPMGAGIYISISSESEIARKYQLQFDDFKKYRLTGDVKYMNHSIQFHEDL